MTGRLDEAQLLRAEGVAAALLGEAPAWVWDVAEGRILAASAAGISFFAEPDLGALLARGFDMARPDMAPLARLGRSLPRDGRARLSLLRFHVGLRGESIPCRCRLLAEIGRDIVLIVAAGGETQADLATRFDAAFGGIGTPVALRPPDGGMLRNAAAAGTEPGTPFEVALAEGRGEFSVGARPAEPEQVVAAPPTPPAERTNARRFTFRIDADGRFAEVGAGFAALVGERSADVAGRPFAELATGDDARGRIEAALASRDTWSNIEVDWPTDGGGHARLRLAALPRFGEGRAFAGFRGFADVLSLAAPVAANGAEPEAEAPAAGPEPAEQVAAGEEAAGEEAAGEALRQRVVDQTEMKRAAAGGETKTAPQRPALVVDLRREAADAADVTPTEAAPSPPSPVETAPGEGSRVLRLHPLTTGPAADRPGALPGALNERESSAFKAIAEALGARWAGQSESQDARLRETGPPPSATGPRGRGIESRKPAAMSRPAGGASAETGTPSGLLADVLDRIPLGLAIVRDNKALAANRAFLELFGYADLDDLELAGGVGALLEGRTVEVDGAVSARRRDDTTFRAEVRLGRTPWLDGSAMLMSAREAAAPPQPGTVEGLTAEEYHAILDTALDGALLLDTDGTIFWANGPAARLLDSSRDALVGRAFAEHVAPAAQDRFADMMKSLAAGALPRLLEEGREIAVMRAGGPVPVEIGLSQVGSGAGLRVVAVLRDMTGWKTAEAELVAARKRAEAASDQKSDFLAKMSHEVRTPLNGIIGFSEVILEERFGPIGNDRYRDYIKDIRDSGGHLLSLVNDLLDLSKVEAGKMELNFTGVRLNDLVEQAVAVMQPQSSRARVVIRSSLRGGLPAVVADARSVRQVLLNILSNAIKFTKAGGQVIVSTAMGETGEVFLRVRDTGVGMSESDVATAMEPFRQLPVAASTGERGTGLGLPLARALTEANRATFTIASKPGEGTMVEIAFPQQRVLAE